MPATANATVTGYIGPGDHVASLVLSPVHRIEYNYDADMVYIYYGTPEKRFPMSYNGVATVTHTISNGVTTITIS